MKTAHIIHSARSGIVRRVIVAQTGEVLPTPQLHPGESHIRLNVKDIKDLHPVSLRKAVAVHKGFDAALIPSGRCAVVDASMRVVAVLMADPDIDDHTVGGAYPDGRLILSDTASVGDIIDDNGKAVQVRDEHQ